MENNFGQFYQDFIKNSLMPKEKEDYNKALKTFKLTQEDFLEFLEDIIDNHFIEIDGEIIPDLSNLAQSKLIKALGTYDNSKIKKEQEALKNLNQHLLSFFTIVENYNLKAGVVDDDYNQKVGNANKVLFDRFAHLNNTPTKEIEFKGQHSFILKRAFKAEIFLKVLNKLKENQFVENETSVGRFQKIFSGTKISNEEKVNWKGTKYDLLLFLISLKTEFRVENDIYDTAIRCFTVRGKEILYTKQISQANNKKSKEQIIKGIVSIFNTRT
jgi:hypothetical protein